MEENEYLHMYEQEERHWWYAGMRAITLSLLPPRSLRRNLRVLDAGCGTGYTMGWFRYKYSARVAGIDCHKTALALSRSRGERELVCGDVAALPIADESFDLVLSFDVLSEVIDAQARAAALAEYRRVLKPGGKLLVRVPAYERLRSSHDTGVSTRHRYGASELRSAVARSGLVPVRCTFANTLLFPAAAVWRLGKKAGLVPAGSDVRPTTRGSPWVNAFFLFLLKTEAALLSRCSLPYGLSLLVVAEKSAPQS